MSSEAPLLSVRGLSIAFRADGLPHRVVTDLSFDVMSGETLAVVGQSGSGKSVTGLSLLRLLPRGSGVSVTGTAWFSGLNLIDADDKSIQKIRGNQISMIFQEPMTSLNPVLPIGRQLTEAVVFHERLGAAEARRRALEMMDRVGISKAASRLDDYPHHFSGGMRQRVMIAMAMSTRPRLLIADEPTTALDVTVQAQVLDLMRELKAEFGTSLILITHDMGVVAEMADRVIVMRHGRKLEEGGVRRIFAAPQIAYTQGLLASVPRIAKDTDSSRLDADIVLSAEGLSKSFRSSTREVVALDDVSFSLRAGETLGLVGESGSGKSTVGRVLTRLVAADRGAVKLDGNDILTVTGARLRSFRKQIQMIFQDPYASLDPRLKVGRQIAEPMIVHGLHRGLKVRDAVAELMGLVGLSADQMARYPHEFSGGQRQRIVIARALAIRPRILIADEPTSALDVMVQAQVLDLLKELQLRFGIAILFITHDMGVMARTADRLAVMFRGKIVEMGPASEILARPRHLYSQSLLASVPVADPTIPRRARIPLDVDTIHRGALKPVAPNHLVATSEGAGHA